MKKQAIGHTLSAALVAAIILFAQFSSQSLELLWRENLPLQARLVASILSAGGGIIEVDQKTQRVTAYSDGLEQMLGYPEGELKGKELSSFMAARVSDEMAVDEYFRTLKDPTTLITRCRMLHQNGSSTEVVVSAFPNMTSGKVVAFVSVSGQVSFEDFGISPQTVSR